MDSYTTSPSSPLSSISSPLSSIGSRSPSPPEDYPTPPESNLSDRGLESITPDVPGDCAARDGPPPAKKRKITGPKERKTEYLNLRTFGEQSSQSYLQNQEEKLNELVQVLRKKRKIVVIAGAGISVSAGSMLYPQPPK
jgi:NAD-dependent histone deacetylase SIR2